MRTVTSVVILSLGAIGCNANTKNKEPDLKIDRSTPADVGRTLCALFKAGKTDLLGQIASWEQQEKWCNWGARLDEQKRTWLNPPADKKYPQCAEDKLKQEWEDFAEELAKSHSPCSVERPASGKLEEIDMVIFGTRDTVSLEKQPDGTWKAADAFFLPAIQDAAEAEELQRRQDAQSGFEKK